MTNTQKEKAEKDDSEKKRAAVALYCPVQYEHCTTADTHLQYHCKRVIQCEAVICDGDITDLRPGVGTMASPYLWLIGARWSYSHKKEANYSHRMTQCIFVFNVAKLLMLCATNMSQVWCTKGVNSRLTYLSWSCDRGMTV